MAGLVAALRRRLEEARRRRALRELRERRETRLEEWRAPRQELLELTALVDRIAAAAPERARRLDLEALLDRYADAAIELARCRAQLAVDPTGPGALPNGPRRRLLDARLACWRRCRERAQLLECDLEDAGELIRLIAQRTMLDAC